MDAVNNISDAASSVITIVGTKLAGKPANREHPFGYGRIEYMTAIIISATVIAAGLSSAKESISSIMSPMVPRYDALSLVIVAAAVVVKLVLGRYVKSVGQKVGSGSLVASGTDAVMDAGISASTLLAALIFLATGLSLEAWLGLLISGVIIKSGVDMLREAISQMLGERVSAETSRAVKQIAAQVPGVRGVYDLILTDYGPDRLMGSLHVEIDDTYDARQIDTLTRELQERIMANCGVLIHTVGVYSHNTSGVAGEMQREIARIARSYEGALQVHGIYVDEATHEARLDVVVSFDVADRQGVCQQIKASCKKRYPAYDFAVTLDVDISD